MDENDVLYQGNALIYLQGRNALLPLRTWNDHQMRYYVGSQDSLIIISDFRHKSVEAAQSILAGRNGFEFADVFNQPAWIEIKRNHGEIKIELNEATGDSDSPILWLGVLEDNLMPVREIEWEVLRPLTSTQTAFAALVR